MSMDIMLSLTFLGKLKSMTRSIEAEYIGLFNTDLFNLVYSSIVLTIAKRKIYFTEEEHSH